MTIIPAIIETIVGTIALAVRIFLYMTDECKN